MAEWKTDTEEVKRIVKACRDFKGSLQEEKCSQFIKNLDKYAQEILTERKNIKEQLEKAKEELEKNRRSKTKMLPFLRGLQVASAAIPILSALPFVTIVAGGVVMVAAEMAERFAKENIEKRERNVKQLQQALEIYSAQAKASRELVERAWEHLKKALHFYTDKHKEFIKRLNQASEMIDNEYNIAPPDILKERDFESPTIVYRPKKSAFDERLKDLREDFSFSLYTDLKNRFHHNSSGGLDRTKEPREHEKDLMNSSYSFDGDFSSAKKNCVKNFKEALQDFAEKIKKSPNDLNAMNEAFNHLKTELERATDDERLKGLRENFASLYADLKDKIHHNALSSDELERITSSKEKEFEKNLEDLMPSSLGVPSYDESLNSAKKNCVKNFKEALQDFAEKIKESPNDWNAMNEAFNHLDTELERSTENLIQKIAPILERHEDYKRQALGYGEFLESKKDSFMIDEQNPYPEKVRFNELGLAEFDSVFSVIVPLESLDKPACAHHALKALETALKNRDLGFDATELEQIAKGFIPKGYLWHFDANVLGNLALVREELLLSVKHTKGYPLWKQFLQTQN